MSARRRTFTTAIIALLATAPPASAQEGGVMAFTNATVLPMDSERVLRDHTVIVQDGRITHVGPSAATRPPAGARVVDARGKYLMPGLIDTHIHLVGGTGAPGDGVWQELSLLVANGVTTARSLAGNAANAIAVREKVASGELVGPRLYVAGGSLNRNSTPTPAAVRTAVAQQAEAGFDFLKTHGVASDVYDTLVVAAKQSGLRLVGHVVPDYGLDRAIAAGQQVEHMDGYLAALVPADAGITPPGGQFFFGAELAHMKESAMPALARRLKQAGIWTSPTLALFELVATPQKLSEYAAWPELRYVPANARNAWTKQLQQMGGEAPPLAAAERYIELRRAMVRALRDAGAPLLTGSDSPQLFLVSGFSLHRELEALAAAGLRPGEVLRAATHDAARYLDPQARFGAIAPGYAADIILLDADPLADVGNTRRLAGVMLRGRWLDRAALDALLAQVERAANPS